MYRLPKDVELSSLLLPRGTRFFVPALTGGPALFLVLAWLVLCAGLRPALAQDVQPPATCFAGAELNAAGLQEIETAVKKMLAGLNADAKTRCIKTSTTRRKGEQGLAYRFQYDKGESFVLYAPEDYHISLARNITFPKGTTTAEVEDALEAVAGKSQPFTINNYANGSLIVTKNSAGYPGIRYFTYDFDSIRVGGDPTDPRTAQKAATQALADNLDSGLSDVVASLDKATSFHVSFGIVETANKTQADAIQKIVIAAMKANGSYRPLHSSNMGISAVALLESAHDNDATRYKTYLEEPLGVSSLNASPGAGTIYSAPNMALADGQSWTLATGDRTFLGRATEADVEALLDWVEDQDALTVVGADPSSPGEGWLTIQGLARPAQFNVGVAAAEDSGHMVVGLKSADVGVVTLTGPLAQLAVGGDIDVGEYGTGTLSASGGATIASYGGYLGYRPGSLGAVTLQGAGTTWQVLNDFCVGYQGAGALYLSRGARLLGNPDGESTLYVGSEPGSRGAVELTDPGTQIQFYEGILSVGSGGGGSMLIQNQAAAYSGYGYIGDQAGSQGTVQIAGAGSLWQVSDSLWVGISGQGALSVRDGAAAGCNYLTVAGFDGAAGALLISGPQSTVNVQQDAFIGGGMQSDDDVPTRNDWVNGGTAAVLVENGGRLSVGGTVWIGGTSTVRLTGGTLEAENLDIMSGGLLASTGGALSIRRQISVDGTLQTDGTLRIGNGMSLVGNGLICAPVTQLAAGSLLAPGHSIGTLSFAGNVSLAPGSRFEVELADAGQCDRIVVSDTLQLGGTLALKKTTPGGPSWGYLFASAGRIEGAFDGIDASALGVAPKRIVPSSQWGLLLKFKDFADLATTQNARNAARAVWMPPSTRASPIGSPTGS